MSERLYDHSFEERFHVLTTGYSAHYTSDVASILTLIRQGRVKSIASGYADYPNVLSEGAQEIVRVTERWYSPEEFEAAFGGVLA